MRPVVPFAPGGAQDVIGRLFAQKVGAVLGQSIVVDNRAGAGGLLGFSGGQPRILAVAPASGPAFPAPPACPRRSLPG